MKIFLLLLLNLSLMASIGNIMAIKGSVSVERDSSKIPATNGMLLEKGDNILTLKKSRVQVMLKDETVVTIGASSSFSFLEYFYDESKKSKLTMKANRGFFRSVTGRIGKLAPERFKVKTASATIGIRGTDFSGEISANREIFKCYQGAITVEFEGDISEIDAGMMAEISKDKIDVKKLKLEKPAVLKVSKILKENKILTEEISDITQIIEDEDNEAEDDSLSVSTSSEDRQEQY